MNHPSLWNCVHTLPNTFKSKNNRLAQKMKENFHFALHFRRTFVEKMFAIHSKVELLKRDKKALGPYARHYYDLFQLSGHPEVEAMLRSPEYAAIKADYDQISRAHS